MKELIHFQQLLYPDLLEAMKKRFAILHTIHLSSPIGRRSIARQTHLQERYIRNELDFLQSQGIVSASSDGVSITEEGKTVLFSLQYYMREVSGLTALEEKLKAKYQVEGVIVVAGDCDTNYVTKQEIGRATVMYLKEHICRKTTVAVTGGSTMLAVAEAMEPLLHPCLFVPARGGLGEKVEYQANTIVAQMAQMSGSDYRLLYVPDRLSASAYETIVEEPSIKETLSAIKQAHMIIHGIGGSISMARGEQEHRAIEQAVCEAFGYYFDHKGDIVHQVKTVGIQLTDLLQAEKVITVAGGLSKAGAIAAYVEHKSTDVLITDEAAAKAML